MVCPIMKVADLLNGYLVNVLRVSLSLSLGSKHLLDHRDALLMMGSG